MNLESPYLDRKLNESEINLFQLLKNSSEMKSNKTSKFPSNPSSELTSAIKCFHTSSITVASSAAPLPDSLDEAVKG